jgi:hypothetical protein
MSQKVRRETAPRGARGLIALWLLSFPIVVAASVYALRLL